MGKKELLLATVAVIVVVGTVQANGRRQPLNRFIRHYEVVDYDDSKLMWDHHRLRRSLIGPREVPLQFTAFGRKFDLRLTPEHNLFHRNFTLLVDGKPQKKHGHLSNIYSGYDLNDPSARVHGNLVHGVFDGSIYSKEDIYEVEPSSRYTRDLGDAPSHSIIYRHSDLDTSAITGATCGSTSRKVQSKLFETQHSAVKERSTKKSHKFYKRQRDPSKVRCWLYIEGDFQFYDAMTASSASEDQRMAQAEALLKRYVSFANEVYMRQDFDDDGTADNIHFGIRTIDVKTTPTSADPIGVEAFLDLHSSNNWTDFCLSYRFTHRDFDNGVLGLAYVAPQPGVNARGGICDDDILSGGRVQTLNTGIVTTVNFGQDVPASVTSITFAHELGHNFGSEHDPPDDPDCVPNSGGRYIMYAFATDGTQPNNRDFSPCSIEMMGNVIRERGQGPEMDNSGCFEVAVGQCGNAVIDPGEECDCGANVDVMGDCTIDPCCNATTCLSRDDVDCSPGAGDCCDANCDFITAASNTICSNETICANSQTCNGSSAKCPDPVPKIPPDDPGYIICDNQSQLLCNNNTGQCDATICAALRVDSCECNSTEEACHVCCMLSDGTCVSTITLAMSNETLRNELPNGMGAVLPIGYPCLAFMGYCDFFNNCMIVDSDGALNRLNTLFSELFSAALDWVRDMWWAVLLIGVGVIIIMFAIVFIFHIILPRPEHAKNRAERRKTIRSKNRTRPQKPIALDATNPNYYSN